MDRYARQKQRKLLHWFWVSDSIGSEAIGVFGSLVLIRVATAAMNILWSPDSIGTSRPPFRSGLSRLIPWVDRLLCCKENVFRSRKIGSIVDNRAGQCAWWQGNTLAWLRTSRNLFDHVLPPDLDQTIHIWGMDFCSGPAMHLSNPQWLANFKIRLPQQTSLTTSSSSTTTTLLLLCSHHPPPSLSTTHSVHNYIAT